MDSKNYCNQRENSSKSTSEKLFMKIMRGLFSPFLKDDKYLKTPKGKTKTFLFILFFMLVLGLVYVCIFLLLSFILKNLFFL